MRLPQRASQHVTESKSFRIFSAKLPEDWIVREVTERDYGVDCYIEICENGFVTGKLLSVQLKGTSAPKVSADGTHMVQYSIEPATLNYWNLLPVPVVLASVDVQREVVYLGNIKSYIRRNYREFSAEKLTTVRMQTMLSSESIDCGTTISGIYDTESDRANFEHTIATFLSTIASKIELLSNHYCRDVFLPLDEDEDDEIGLLTLYRDLKYLALKFGLGWRIKAIETMIQEGQVMFGTTYLLYEKQVAEFVKDVVPVIKELVLKSLDVLVSSESDYWKNKDFMLWRYAKTRSFQQTLMELDEF